MWYRTKSAYGNGSWTIVGDFKTADAARKAGLDAFKHCNDRSKMRVEIVRMWSETDMKDIGYMLYNPIVGITYNGVQKVDAKGKLYTPKEWKQ